MERLNRLRSEMEAWMREQWPDAVPVHGEGRLGVRVMLIGEAPGEQETLARRPFVGKAGKNLDAFLEMAQIDRGDLYVSNVVKMRPWKLSKSGNIVNRPPTRAEIEAYKPWLFREIEIVQPQIIATLGNVPLGALTDMKQTIGERHGKPMETPHGTLYPMYHPASVIYNRALEPVYREDVYRLGELIRKNEA